MFNRFTVTILSILTVVLFAGCVALTPSIDEAQQTFCEDLNTYAQAVVDLRSIDADSTIDEFNAAVDAVADAWDNLRDSAITLSDAQANAIEEANENLADTVTNVPGDATLGEAQAGIQQAALDTLAAYVDINVTECSVALDA